MALRSGYAVDRDMYVAERGLWLCKAAARHCASRQGRESVADGTCVGTFTVSFQYRSKGPKDCARKC